jgi:hypothetical protein
MAERRVLRILRLGLDRQLAKDEISLLASCGPSLPGLGLPVPKTMRGRLLLGDLGGMMVIGLPCWPRFNSVVDPTSGIHVCCYSV